MTREFGATAWGRAWLRQIEPVLITGAPDRNLPRARALARRDITDLAIDGPRATARLTERGRGHTITLDIPAWTDQEQRTVAGMINGIDASHARDLPDHLAADLVAAGVRIAPRVDDITASSDTGHVGRRQVLAVCYALVQRIDEEPVLAVRLRTPRAASPGTEIASPVGLLALTDIDPMTFYGLPTTRR